MALYQRDGIWYIKITGPDGKPVRHSTRTADRQRAEEYHDRLKVSLWEQQRLGVKPKHTWDEAALKWLQEKAAKRSYRDDVQRIRWFTTHLRGKALDEITREMVDKLVSKIGGSDRTRDLYVALIRAVFRRAMREWEWIDRVPAFRTYQRGDRMRVRWLTDEQAKTLLNLLPPHQKDVVLFALATGARQRNVLDLTWDQIVLPNRIAWLHRTKNDAPLSLPLNDLAMAVLERQQGRHPKWVFTYRGQHLQSANTRAWRKALKEAGITAFRWHDLRHTWASWLRQAGTPTWALQEMAGWKSESMVRRYAHLNTEHLAPFAARLTFGHTPLEGGAGKGG